MADDKEGQLLEKLAHLNELFDSAEDDIYQYAAKTRAPLYEKLKELTHEIEDFWPSAIRESRILDDYLTVDDLDLIDSLVHLGVEYFSSPQAGKSDFIIHFEFKENDYLEIDSLKLSKTFRAKKGPKDATKKYLSDPVPIKWKKGRNLTQIAEQGESSFFSWFDYVGEGPGDFKCGSELALSLIDEMIPFAIVFYTKSLNDADIEDEYDISTDLEEEQDEDDDIEESLSETEDSELDHGTSKKRAKTDR